ncbi:MAG TPA: DinB family protein, partial [Ignavibacteria bacterium]|nr:DinB family protein [Ignavibacteria bacterium]
MDTLKEQYKLIISSREAVLNYCENITPEHLKKELGSFNNNSITYLLLHISNTYLFWLKKFTFKEEFEYFTGENIKDINGIRKAFSEVNTLVDKLLNSYADYNTP